MLGQTPRATTLSITTTPAKAPYASVKVVSVQSSSTPLLAANPKRRGFAVKNMSVGTIYVSPNKNLTIAGGGDPGWPVLSNNAEHNDTYTGPVYAVVAAPGPLDLYVWEEFDL